MKKMSQEKLQRELQAKMLGGEYTVEELYTIYLGIMGIDFNLSHKAVEEKTFRNKLTEWSNTEGSWLVKKGMGKSATYHKWVCHRSDMSRSQILMTVRRALGSVFQCQK